MSKFVHAWLAQAALRRRAGCEQRQSCASQTGCGRAGFDVLSSEFFAGTSTHAAKCLPHSIERKKEPHAFGSTAHPTPSAKAHSRTWPLTFPVRKAHLSREWHTTLSIKTRSVTSVGSLPVNPPKRSLFVDFLARSATMGSRIRHKACLVGSDFRFRCSKPANLPGGHLMRCRDLRRFTLPAT